MFSIAANAQHDFQFMVHIAQMIGEKKGLSVAYQRAFWLHKHNGLGGNVVVELSGVLRIIAANANDFHGRKNTAYSLFKSLKWLV
jgi:hypothetical protein